MEYDAHGMHTTHKMRPIKTGIYGNDDDFLWHIKCIYSAPSSLSSVTISCIRKRIDMRHRHDGPPRRLLTQYD